MPLPACFHLHVLIWDKFFEVVVGRELCEYISKRAYSLIILGTCGSVVNVPKSLEEVRGVVKKCVSTFPTRLSF
jgi:hypothetical protein